MTDLRRGEQRGGSGTSGVTHPRDGGNDDDNRGASFGTSEPGTAGTNRDADETGRSKNEGHGHAREDRGRRGE